MQPIKTVRLLTACEKMGTGSDTNPCGNTETGYAKVPVPDISQALTWALGFLLAFTAPSQAVQIGDLVRIKGSETSKLVGMGLVVGLKGTGDGGNFVPAIDSLAKAMRHLINESTVKEELKNSKNVAVVYLEATTPTSGVQEGDRIDVYVSSLGAAKSLQGGRLLLMPMTGPLPDSLVYAYAFGQVTIENEDTPTTGVIRAGAQIALEIRSQAINDGRLTLVIRGANATYQMADTIATTINDLILEGPKIARALDQKRVEIQFPKAELKNPAPFIAEILNSYLDPAFIETGARVRINEKSGTIVISGDVKISPVTISQGGLMITMITPEPPATPETPRVEEHRFVGITTEKQSKGKLTDLIEAFNQLKVEVKERIAIIKEIHSMGKLHADLVFE